MSEKQSLKLHGQTLEKLEAYGQLLNKDMNMIIHEALEDYFKAADKMIVEKSMKEKDPDTDFGFDEFWEDVDF